MPLDYSKWDHIEISDDEDDTHPNVDTASLFKWRHEARVQRKEEEKKEQAKKEAEKKSREQMIQKLEKKREELAQKTDAGDAADAQLKGIEQRLSELKTAQEDFLAKEAELERLQREHPKWDVDNISQDKTSKTIINSYDSPQKEPEDEDAKVDSMQQWFQKNRDTVIKYSELKDMKQSQQFLAGHLDLLCDHMASFLVIYCVDLQVDDDDAAVENAARQTICIQYILELSRTLKRDPRECFNAFFARFATADEQYQMAFQDEVKSLIERVKDRAQARLEEAKARMEKEEREKRLGPAGLDPIEVLETLPEKMRIAFQNQDTPMLQEAFSEVPEDQVKEVYDKVVGSGLWVPGGGDAAADEDEENDQ